MVRDKSCHETQLVSFGFLRVSMLNGKTRGTTKTYFSKKKVFCYIARINSGYYINKDFLNPKHIVLIRTSVA